MTKCVLYGSYGFVTDDRPKKKLQHIENAYKKKTQRWNWWRITQHDYWFTCFQHRYTYSHKVYWIGLMKRKLIMMLFQLLGDSQMNFNHFNITDQNNRRYFDNIMLTVNI